MPIKATVVLKDSNNYYRRMRVETETEVLATAQSAVDGLLTELDPCTDLSVEHVSYSFKDATQTFAGAAGSNVDLGATFRGRGSDGDIKVLKIPGFPQSKVGANGSIDLTDGDVAALLALWEAAGPFTLSDGETVDEWISGSRDK